MSKLKSGLDAFGTEVNVGDTVVYGDQTRGPRTLKKTIVTAITPKGVKVHPEGKLEQYGDYLLRANFMKVWHGGCVHENQKVECRCDGNLCSSYEGDPSDSDLWLQPN